MSHLGYLVGKTTTRQHRKDLIARLANARRRSTTLSEVTLRGARPTLPIRLIIASDVSGSMSSFAAAREAALDQLIAWAPGNLRTHDEIGVLVFAETAEWSLRPTTVAELAEGGSRRVQTQLDGGGTAWRPVADRVSALADSRALLSLWLVSDGEYPDYPASVDDGRRALQDAGIQSMPLLVPSRDADVPAVWQDVFPRELSLSFEGTDADATAMAFAHSLASVTGQRLVRTVA